MPDDRTVPLVWGDDLVTWDYGMPLRVDPDEWDAMERELMARLAAIGGIVPDPRSHIEVYKDASGTGWRWTAYAANGEIVGDSGEAYSRRWSARRAARRFLPGWAIVNVKS